MVKALPAFREGGAQALDKVFSRGGVGLHLVQRQVHGAALDLILIPVHLALPAFQLVLHLVQAGFDLQQVGQRIGLGLQLQQALPLGLQVGQAGFQIHVLCGDVLSLLALVHQVAGLCRSLQKALVVFLRHPQGQGQAALVMSSACWLWFTRLPVCAAACKKLS